MKSGFPGLKMGWIVLVICLFVNAINSISQVPQRVLQSPRFLFRTTDNTFVKFTNVDKITVYLFLSPECPLCQNYTLTLNELYSTYHKQGVDFFGIIPGKRFSVQEIKNFCTAYKLLFPVYIDEHFQFTKWTNVHVTPECIVFDKKGKAAYRGRIDNWMYAVGKKRARITEHNLKDALTDLISNRKVRIANAKAIGCFIE